MEKLRSLQSSSILNGFKKANEEEEEYGTKKCTVEDAIGFFQRNPNPSDKTLHNFAKKKGFNPHYFEAKAYQLATIAVNVMTGGLSKGNKDKVDPKELKAGIAVEAEHTGDKTVAEKIARDHLKEHPKYYTALKLLEKILKMDKLDELKEEVEEWKKEKD